MLSFDLERWPPASHKTQTRVTGKEQEYHSQTADCIVDSSTHRLFYTGAQADKCQEIAAAGHSPKSLAQHGILLDTDLRQGAHDQTTPNTDRR